MVRSKIIDKYRPMKVMFDQISKAHGAVFNSVATAADNVFHIVDDAELTSLWKPLSLADIGDFADALSVDILDVEYFLDDPIYIDAYLVMMLDTNIMESINQNRAELYAQLEKVADPIIQRLPVADGVLTNRTVYQLHDNSHTYGGYNVYHDMLIDINLQSVWLYNTTSLEYNEHPISIGGAFNPVLFVDPDSFGSTAALQNAINDGHIPIPNFSDPNDPLQVLAIPFYNELLNSYISSYEILSRFGGMDYYNQWLNDISSGDNGDLIISQLVTVFNKVQLEKASRELGIELYDLTSDSTQNMYEFFHEFTEALAIDSLRNANPAYNIAGANLLNDLLIDEAMTKMVTPDLMSITSLNRIDSSPIGQFFLNYDLASGIRLNDFIPYESSQGVHQVGSTITDYIDVSFQSYIRNQRSLPQSFNQLGSTGYIEAKIHYAFGNSNIMTTSPTHLVNDLVYAKSTFERRYDTYNLVNAKNTGLLNTVALGIDLNFSWDFISWGVRAKQAELPWIVDFMYDQINKFSDNEMISRYYLEALYG